MQYFTQFFFQHLVKKDILVSQTCKTLIACSLNNIIQNWNQHWYWRDFSFIDIELATYSNQARKVSGSTVKLCCTMLPQLTRMASHKRVSPAVLCYHSVPFKRLLICSNRSPFGVDESELCDSCHQFNISKSYCPLNHLFVKPLPPVWSNLLVDSSVIVIHLLGIPHLGLLPPSPRSPSTGPFWKEKKK